MRMISVSNDPLLAIARFIILAGQGLMALAAIALVAGLPLVIVMQEEITTQLRAEYSDPALLFPLAPVVGIMVVALAIVALTFLFLRKLRQIVDTVGAGDPFVPGNAVRLTAMAWLMLAVEILSILIAVLAYNVMRAVETAVSKSDLSLDFSSVDLSGIILVVTLFILARVFRAGTRMRDDLEGTV